MKDSQVVTPSSKRILPLTSRQISVREEVNSRALAETLLAEAGINPRPVPACVPCYTEQDRHAVLRVLNGESVWRLNSEAAQRLLATFWEHINPSTHLLPVINATSGLHVTLSHLIESRGPRVFVPAWTWFAVGAAVLNAGGTPVFIDLNPQTLELVPFSDTDEADLALVSHLFGLPSLTDAHINWLRSHDIPLIEDCAQTVMGGTSAGQQIGQLGDVAVYSFNGSKAIPAGEGGMIATDDDALAEYFLDFTMAVASPREAAIRRFNDASRGWNYRLASLPASLAESLIHTLPERLESAKQSRGILCAAIGNRDWLRPIGETRPDTAPLGCPICLTKKFVGLSIAQSRGVLYYALRLAGFPVSIWVADAIPTTRLLQNYYVAHRCNPPNLLTYAGATLIADTHIVFATNTAASDAYLNGADRLMAILNTLENHHDIE